MTKSRFYRSKAGISLLFLLLFALTLVFLAPFVAGTLRTAGMPDIGDPFDVEAHLNVEIPDDENAFTLYREAADRFRLLVDLRYWNNREERMDLVERYLPVNEEGWPAADEEIRNWHLENLEALNIWKNGTARSMALEKSMADVTNDTLFPITASAKEMGRSAILEASRLAETGLHQEAWTWYRATIRCSRHLQMNREFIGRLWGTSLHALVADAIVSWSGRSDVDATILQLALRDIMSTYEMTPRTSDTLKYEYLTQRNFLRQIHTQSMSASIFMSLSGEQELLQRLLALQYANLIHFYDRPRSERPPIAKGDLHLFELDEQSENVDTLYPAGDIQRWAARLLLDVFLIQLPVPGKRQSADVFDKEKAQQSALTLAVALQIFNRQHDRFPDTLAALVPDILTEIPRDPFGQGEPMRYRLDAHDGGGGVLWSIGADGIDHDAEQKVGEGSRTGDWVFEVKAPGDHRRNIENTPEN